MNHPSRAYDPMKPKQPSPEKKKSSGGWFSCFSNTAVEHPAQNMITPAQAQREEQQRQMDQLRREYDRQDQDAYNTMNQQQPHGYGGPIGPQGGFQGQPGYSGPSMGPTGGPSNGPAGQFSPFKNSNSNLQQLRHESKMRLRNGIPYSPGEGPNTTPGSKKDLSYYTRGVSGQKAPGNHHYGGASDEFDDQPRAYPQNKPRFTPQSSQQQPHHQLHHKPQPLQNSQQQQQPQYSKLTYMGKQQAKPQHNDHYRGGGGGPHHSRGLNDFDENFGVEDDERDRPAHQQQQKQRQQEQYLQDYQNYKDGGEYDQFPNQQVDDYHYNDPLQADPRTKKQNGRDLADEARGNSFEQRRLSKAMQEDEYEMEQHNLRQTHKDPLLHQTSSQPTPKKQLGDGYDNFEDGGYGQNQDSGFWTKLVVEDNLAFSHDQKLETLNRIRVRPGQDKNAALNQYYFNLSKKFEDTNDQMLEDLNIEYKASQRYRDAGADVMTEEQYKEQKQEIHWDIAWQIFDEVNANMDVDRYIDLNCLDPDDAIAITKQKVFDVAQMCLKDYQASGVGADNVLNVVYADHHLKPVKDYSGRNPMKNVVYEMVREELGMDCHLEPHSKLIMIRINEETSENPVLKEW